ncbi:xylulokinase [Thalassotalea litorea]|uniref:Xylulose kinase n=1 Tax=Thalassotalea litorea TaxID=2020715 RepID=A0A5R9IMF6_9GAMM|nr:xylulokinase [Thalassotalea litorea]TLU66715.1 xylulokinase [Thalassotalea litorea]
MYLGIDLGTSGVKVVVLDEQKQLVAQGSAPLEVSYPAPLHSEQNPQDWWQATNVAIQQIKHQQPDLLAKVVAVGLSGQMHGATLLDEYDNVIRPAILWNDGRSQQQCRQIEQMVPESRNITGNIAMPGFTAPKILWLQEHEPQAYQRIAKVLLPKDYLRFKMTGDYASDMSDSAGTLWLDVGKRSWSDEMLQACGLTQSHMPKLFEGNQPTGTLSAEIAKAWGMAEVPVAAGGGDNAAGAAGIGVINPGDAFLSLGTSGVYFVANETYKPNPDGALHTFCHCIDNTWHQMSVILSAASCLSWVIKLTGADNETSFLEEISALNFSEPGQVMFLPYLTGERTPHNDPDAKGVFIGLTQSTDRAELGRAVLEGVAFAFADGQKSLLDAGTPINQVSVIGGGSKSPLWGKILASVLNQTLIYRNGGDVGPAFGAANLARLAVSNETAASVCTSGEIIQTIGPDAVMSEFYAKQWQTYQQLYRSLKPIFRDLRPHI